MKLLKMGKSTGLADRQTLNNFHVNQYSAYFSCHDASIYTSQQIVLINVKASEYHNDCCC